MIAKIHRVLITNLLEIISGVTNSSSSHSDDRKNNFLILGVAPTYGINRILDHQRKKFNVNFTKGNLKHCLSLHYNADNSYLFVNEKEILKFKSDSQNVNFPTQFRLGRFSKGFSFNDSAEVCFNGNVYNFSVDYNLINKFGILNAQKCLNSKSNIM